MKLQLWIVSAQKIGGTVPKKKALIRFQARNTRHRAGFKYLDA